MPISFSNIPANWKVPLYWIEADPSMAGLGQPRQPALLAGTMLQTGVAIPDVPLPIATQAQADVNFGVGSEMSRMFKSFFRNNFADMVWGVGVAEPLNGVKASGPITVNVAPTAAGTIHLYIGAEHVPINVGERDTEEEIAEAIAEAINEREYLPVTASTTAAPPLLNVAPFLSGAPETGVEVSVTDGSWTGNPVPTFTYTWQSGGANIAGETANTYVLDASDVGNMITATVTAANTEGTVPVISNAIGPVTVPVSPPVNSAIPVISGAPVVGTQLSTSNGTWSGSPAFSYGWKRDGVAIGGANAQTYTLVAADDGTMISVTVIAENSAGIVSEDSDEIGPITLTPLSAPVNTVPPELTETVTPLRARSAALLAAPTDVILTCKWAGVSGNDIRISLNYAGAIGGEILPQGLDIALPPTGMLTGGVGVPDFANAISNLGETQVEYLAMPYTDDAPLRAWEQEFGFGDSGRWGWMRQLYGGIYSARRGGYADLIAFGATRNGAQTSVMAMEMGTLSASFEVAAAYCAKAQRALTNDPARPLQSLELEGIFMAPPDQRFILSETNLLGSYGLATQIKSSADNVTPMIARETTTYQLNLYGFEDDAYELVTTLSTLAALFRSQRHIITTKYARCKLANDGTRFGPGQRIATPGIIKAELVSQYRIDMSRGLCEDITNFKRHLIVERDTNNPNRLNVLYPPDLINQLRIFAVLAQFRLQYNRMLDEQIAA
jgi:phage tail sheath gpL-like